MSSHIQIVLLASVMLFQSDAWQSGDQAKNIDSLIQDAQKASVLREYSKCEELAGKAIALDPKRAEAWLLRAEARSGLRKPKESAGDFAEAANLDAKSAGVWQRKGEEEFKSSQFAASVNSFDRFLELVPDQRPHHWQRGISLYYAGRYKDGKAQFELHQTVNSNDVENAVWHFLCTLRAEGLIAARKQLIPIAGDPRIPMAEVHRLFAGKGTAESVLSAAKGVSGPRADSAQFYADLYLGLYYDAIGDRKLATKHIAAASKRHEVLGYMGDVALVHEKLLQNAKR